MKYKFQIVLNNFLESLRIILAIFHSPAILAGDMEAIIGILPYIQIALSVMLIATILLQQTGSGLGGAFGADNFSSGFHTRRGLERTLFYVSIVLGVLFALTALTNLFVA